MTKQKIIGELGDLPKDFLGEIEWKRFPDNSVELRDLLRNPCVVDFDTLDDDSVKIICDELKRTTGPANSFWVYSRKQGSMKLVSRGCKSPLVSLVA